MLSIGSGLVLAVGDLVARPDARGPALKGRKDDPMTLLALVLLALPIVLVGPSRLYLGQHWLSDVLGGYAVATLLLVPYCWAYTRWRSARPRSERSFNH